MCNPYCKKKHAQHSNFIRVGWSLAFKSPMYLPFGSIWYSRAIQLGCHSLGTLTLSSYHPLALLILNVVAAKSSTPSMKAAWRTYIFRPAEWRCRWKQLQKLVNQPCIWESEWPGLFWNMALDISSSGLEWMTIDVHWCTVMQLHLFLQPAPSH